MSHILFLILFFITSSTSFAQEGENTYRAQDATYHLEKIQISDEEKENEQNQSYESIHSETTIPQKKIQRTNPSDVSEILQRVPGVSVSGGSEAQNKRISIRGLDGYRVVQQVDGAQRIESTQSGHSSSIAVEPEMLAQIKVQNGADSVSHGAGAIGGNINYKTLSSEDLLTGKQKNATKLKITSDSVTEGVSRSIISATKLSESSSVLLGVTQRETQKVESGAPTETSDKREVEKINSLRSTYLGKYTYVGDHSSTDFKLEYSDAASKNASYLAGYGEANSDYQKSTLETVVNHKQNISENFQINMQSYFNTTASIKDTHTAFLGYASTLGRVEDKADNIGVKLSGDSALIISPTLYLQSQNGVEALGSRISEDDGTDSPNFGESQGHDTSLFTENTLNFNDKKFAISLGARYSHYRRESNKLSIKSPSREDNTFSNIIGISYSPAEWVKVSGKYGNSNRAPNVREMYYGTGKPWKCHRPSKECTNSPNAKLSEEMANSKEISLLFKRPNSSEAQQLKLTYFDENIGDYIEMMPEMYRLENGKRVIAGPADATHREYKYRNLSTVLRRGIEAQALIEWGNWELETMYSMIRMDCIDCPDMYTATKIDEPLYSAPADKTGLGVSYEFTSINLTLGADAQFISSQKRLSDRYLNAGYGTPGYEVYGLNLKWSPTIREFTKIDMGLGVSNLLDRKYVVHNSPSGTFELGQNINLSLAAIF